MRKNFFSYLSYRILSIYPKKSYLILRTTWHRTIFAHTDVHVATIRWVGVRLGRTPPCTFALFLQSFSFSLSLSQKITDYYARRLLIIARSCRLLENPTTNLWSCPGRAWVLSFFFFIIFLFLFYLFIYLLLVCYCLFVSMENSWLDYCCSGNKDFFLFLFLQF